MCVCAYFFAFAFVVKVEWNYPTAKKNALGRCLSNNCLCDGIWCCFSLYDMDIYRIYTHTMHMLEGIHFGFGLISVRAFVCSNPCAPPHSVNYNSTCDFIIINASLSALSRYSLFACWFASLQRAQFFFHIFSIMWNCLPFVFFVSHPPNSFFHHMNPYISPYMNKRHLETISGPSDNFCCDYFPSCRLSITISLVLCVLHHVHRDRCLNCKWTSFCLHFSPIIHISSKIMQLEMKMK